METRILHYFIAVAEELHFGNAAKRLHISQPPLSQQIMKLEEELGVPLFQRNKRSVRLTAAGSSLLKDAREIISHIEQAKHNLTKAATGEHGQLTLGYIAPSLNTVLPDAVSLFKNQYPHVQFTLRQKGTNQQLEAIRSGSIDGGIVRLFRHNLKDLEATIFHKERYALVVPSNHTLATRRSVELAEIEAEPLIFFSRHSQPILYDEWMRLFTNHGFTPAIVQEVESKSAAISLTAAQVGISIVPESSPIESPHKVKKLNLLGPTPPLEVSFVTKKNVQSPTAKNFLAILKKIAFSSSS